MGIPNREQARYSSLQDFISFFKEEDNHPSFTNLFSVHFSSPPMLVRGGQVRSDRMQTETGDNGLLLDYYAKTVNLPSKQVTTGQMTAVGSGFKFATGASFSQISMTFQVPRSQKTRALFERWTQLMANDANQYTDYYRNYCSPRVVIYKWERGGGDVVAMEPRLLRAARESGADVINSKLNKLTAAWVLENVFPYNIGSVQLDNSQAKTMDLSIQFYYERYRFYPEDKFDDPGVSSEITIPSSTDNVTTPATARNQTVTQQRRNQRDRDVRARASFDPRFDR